VHLDPSVNDQGSLSSLFSIWNYTVKSTSCRSVIFLKHRNPPFRPPVNNNLPPCKIHLRRIRNHQHEPQNHHRNQKPAHRSLHTGQISNHNICTFKRFRLKRRWKHTVSRHASLRFPSSPLAITGSVMQAACSLVHWNFVLYSLKTGDKWHFFESMCCRTKDHRADASVPRNAIHENAMAET
jgi:hypothetical protein